jgi:hypothetical protein
MDLPLQTEVQSLRSLRSFGTKQKFLLHPMCNIRGAPSDAIRPIRIALSGAGGVSWLGPFESRQASNARGGGWVG